MGKASSFTDYVHFYNQKQITDGPAVNIQYFHLINNNNSSSRPPSLTFGEHSSTLSAMNKNKNLVGKRMGKTRFMREVSNFDNKTGNVQLILPRNHVTKFSQPFKEQMTNGTQNTNPGFLNVRYEDYSSASFYRVKVTGGQNQIRVQSGNPGVGSDDKIIYDDSGGGGAL
jgi:hypothetical protein